MSEELVIRLCAPTLAGLKTGSLFSAEYVSVGANLVSEGVIANGDPGPEETSACNALGAAL